jgi:methylthioribulose-1-phosphate dehydratase
MGAAKVDSKPPWRRGFHSAGFGRAAAKETGAVTAIGLREWAKQFRGEVRSRFMAAVEWSDELLLQAEALCRVAHEAYGRGWVPATAGNFSFRDAASGRIFITASGLDKGAITPADLLEIDRDCGVLAGSGKPSAETSLHGVIYRERPGTGAIVHVHSIWNTLLSDEFAKQGAVPLEGYELLKALSGVETHVHRELVPILENSQEYEGLAKELSAALVNYPEMHGVLLRRHGLYTWGESVAGARRHLEALEFLFETKARRLMSPFS